MSLRAFSTTAARARATRADVRTSLRPQPGAAAGTRVHNRRAQAQAPAPRRLGAVSARFRRPSHLLNINTLRLDRRERGKVHGDQRPQGRPREGALARAGDRRAEELDPHPLQRAGARPGRRAAHLGHRPRRLAALRLRGRGRRREGAITLGAKKLYEIARSLPDSDVRIKVLPDAWAAIECERVELQDGGAAAARTSRPCRRRRRPRGIEIPGDVLRELIARTAFAITAEDARYYLAGALLVLDKDGGGHGGHRRAPARLRPPQGAAQGDRGRARAGPAQGDPRARAPARGRRTTAHVPAGGRTTWCSRSAAARWPPR